MVKDFLRGRKLNHIAQIHDADSVRNILYNRKVMRDKQIGQLGIFLQILKQVDNLRLNGYIQRRNRFIADYKLRLNSQRSGDTDTLTLTAGELMRETMQKIRLQTALLHDSKHLRLHAVIFLDEHMMRLHTVADDIAYRHPRIQRRIRILKNHLQIRPQQAHLIVFKTSQINAAVFVSLRRLKIRVVRIGCFGFFDFRALCIQLLLQRAALFNQRIQLFLLSVQPRLRILFLNAVKVLCVKFCIAHLGVSQLNLFEHAANLCADFVFFLEQLHSMRSVFDRIKAAKYGNDIVILAFQLCLHQVQFVERRQLFVVIVRHLLICFGKLFNLLTELMKLPDLLIQLVQGLTDIVRRDLLKRLTVIQRFTRGLLVELEQRSAEGRFSAAGFADKAKRFALDDVNRNAVICLAITTFSNRKILF